MFHGRVVSEGDDSIRIFFLSQSLDLFMVFLFDFFCGFQASNMQIQEFSGSASLYWGRFHTFVFF